ncbi:MAG TPA: zinc-binding alcohol dehydrogenase family protein [Blastocatellia bacterium]|jgi:NADPH:quinone reductase-like Zn-dependent oxidoreductase
MQITTEAWVLYKGENAGSGKARRGELIRESFSFPTISEEEVLIEPIYGSWEGNMGHALERRPVDICRQRNEEKVVLCNAGVARVLKTGAAVRGLNEGDICMVTGNRIWDKRGYMIKAFAYDAPNTVGLLARRTKVHQQQLIRIPEDTKYSLRQWAAFSIRYVTAWANWKQAYGSLRLQLSEQEYPSPFVWGWGGGVALAELELANLFGCRTAMLASNKERLKMIAESGIEPIDRQQFGNLNFDQGKYDRDPEFAEAYRLSEEAFLKVVKEKTDGEYVSIFIDNIGTPVIRATLKALACPGVITTAGWKCGMSVNLVRAIECMKWHTHVHTHYSRYSDTVESVRFAEQNGWMPRSGCEVYSYDNVPMLARDFSEGKMSDYFPLFEVNRL